MEILIVFLAIGICWGIIDHIFFMPKRKKAAEEGNAQAQYELGRHHELSANYVSSEAIKWYSKAAQQGHERAILRLAEIKREEEQSCFFRELQERYRRGMEAVKNGDAEEQYRLGMDYYGAYENEKLSSFYDQAIEWFLRAANLGHEEALARLKEIYRTPMGAKIIRRSNFPDITSLLGDYPSEYTLDWDSISKQYRKKQHYICQDCGVDLNSEKYLLHTHHLNRDKYDNREENLIALCANCHKKQPFHERRVSVSDSDLKKINLLRKQQGLRPQ